METMTKPQHIPKNIPQTDSVAELAAFWESHDVTDFEEELEEVREPVFERPAGAKVQVELPQNVLAAIQRLAQEQHIDYTKLMQDWILEKLFYTEMMRRVSKDFQMQS